MPQRCKGRKSTGREVIRQRCRKYSSPIFVKLKVQAEADKERGDE
jgi:hypothetical protein